MKMNKVSFGAILGVSAMTFASLAGADEVNWTGFYLGANAGYGWGKSDVSTTTVFSPTGYFATTSVPAIANASAGKIRPNGFAGGVTLGFNNQTNKTVLGVELDLDAVDISKSRTSGALYPCCAPTSFSNTQSINADWLLTARGRVGYAITERGLLYATGGLAVTNLENKNHFTDTFASVNESGAESKTKYGWVLGFGYEHALENKWSLKAEYAHVDFGDVSSQSNNLTGFTPPIAFPTNTFTNRGDLKIDLIRIGINKSF